MCLYVRLAVWVMVRRAVRFVLFVLFSNGREGRSEVMYASGQSPFVRKWCDVTGHTDRTHGDCANASSAAVYLGGILGSHVTC